MNKTTGCTRKSGFLYVGTYCMTLFTIPKLCSEKQGKPSSFVQFENEDDIMLLQ